MDIVTLLILSFITIVSAYYSDIPQLKVVGGIDADANSVPFIVSLLVRNRRREWVPFCAGSLLSESWILTAAHCLVLEPYRINVAAGHHNQDDFEDTTQFRKTDFYVQHEDFNRIGPYDVGLLHVSRPFQLTPQVQRVVLSGTGEYDGKATIYGWGSLLPSRRRQFPSTLQTANLTIVENSYCDAIFPVEINEGNICAGLPDGGKGGCVGDSGGPLVQNGLQIGIVSWGPITCNPSEGPSVFTRVSYYIPWIQKQIDKNSNIAGELDEDDEDDDDDEEEDDNIENDDILGIDIEITTKEMDDTTKTKDIDTTTITVLE